MKIAVLIRTFERPNGIVRYAYGLQEEDSRFKVYNIQEPLFHNHYFEAVAKQTFGPLRSSLGLSSIDADAYLPVTSIEAIPIILSRKSPFGLVVHDLMDWLPWKNRDLLTRSAYAIQRMYDWTAIQKANAIFCNTHLVRSQILHFFGEKKDPIVANPGLTGSFLHKTRTRSKPIQEGKRSSYSIFMIPESLNSDKGVDKLILALGQVARKLSITFELRLLSSDYRGRLNYLLNLGKNLNVSLKFMSNLSDSELLDLYSSSDIFYEVSNFDWFNFPPLEAMACGTPVIYSSILADVKQGFGESVIQASFDENSIANAISYVIENDEARAKLVVAGYNILDEFTMKKTAARIHEGFEKVLVK